ncbi:putative calcium-binding protein [Xenococcus sp. PCC 7305]|uniref:calcium-binding protein n=1 Tax=Xenococcus sp. PCC 7305 TaxID=102125 RepID=UPI0002ACAFA7|nr:calcium-binding protein [Xenococcus sp. PCC 7305]ELS00577.1 putative calcium-binding protein [Xenococcus sp. PCC 7305]
MYTATDETLDQSILGTDNDDTLLGGVGNDTIVGNRGNDLKIGGEGNDLLIWNNGDGSDIMEGDAGYDTTQVNGAVDNGDNFELRANGDRAEFERLNLGNFVLDVDNVEQFEINGGGGDDTLTVKDLTGTDVQKVFFNGGEGNDFLDASLSNVEIIANGEAGNDFLSGSSVPAIIDNLDGGIGDDTIIGNRGDDIKIGGEGNDRLIWNNGDGSDIMEGDAGYDVTEVNGAVDNGDDFELRANGERTEFERLNLGNFVLDVDNVERFEINGGGGDDTLTIKDLTGTDVAEVVFTGDLGNDILDASQTNVQVTALGGDGNDSLTGGSGNDFLDGGDGNDTLIGGTGADTFVVGANGINTIADFNFSEGDKIQISTFELGISSFSLEQISYDLNDQTLYYGDTGLATFSNSLEGYNAADYIELV